MVGPPLFSQLFGSGKYRKCKGDVFWLPVELQDSDGFQLYHMETDLGITDKQYLIALTAFFFPYALLEVRGVCAMFARTKPYAACKQCHSQKRSTLNVAFFDDVRLGNRHGMC